MCPQSSHDGSDCIRLIVLGKERLKRGVYGLCSLFIFAGVVALFEGGEDEVLVIHGVGEGC
jgi:hypothetical protein